MYSYCDALRWAADIASALHYLHSCQPRVIHRDLKLENVLLTGEIHFLLEMFVFGCCCCV